MAAVGRKMNKKASSSFKVHAYEAKFYTATEKFCFA